MVETEAWSPRPANPYFLELQGQILLESGRPDEALASLRQAVEMTGNDPLIASQFGHALIATEDRAHLDEAERVLRAAVGRDRENPFAWYQLGIVYGTRGDTPRAQLASAEQQIMSGRPREALQNAQAADAAAPLLERLYRAGDVALQASASLNGNATRTRAARCAGSLPSRRAHGGFRGAAGLDATAAAASRHATTCSPIRRCCRGMAVLQRASMPRDRAAAHELETPPRRRCGKPDDGSWSSSATTPAASAAKRGRHHRAVAATRLRVLSANTRSSPRSVVAARMRLRRAAGKYAAFHHPCSGSARRARRRSAAAKARGDLAKPRRIAAGVDSQLPAIPTLARLGISGTPGWWSRPGLHGAVGQAVIGEAIGRHADPSWLRPFTSRPRNARDATAGRPHHSMGMLRSAPPLFADKDGAFWRLQVLAWAATAAARGPANATTAVVLVVYYHRSINGF